jgi:hypothetical protein
LDQVITDKAERATLRKDSGLFVDRAIPEPEYKTRVDSITLDGLHDIPNRNASTFPRFQREKAVGRPLEVEDGNGFGVQLC